MAQRSRDAVPRSYPSQRRRLFASLTHRWLDLRQLADDHHAKRTGLPPRRVHPAELKILRLRMKERAFKRALLFSSSDASQSKASPTKERGRERPGPCSMLSNVDLAIRHYQHRDLIAVLGVAAHVEPHHVAPVARQIDLGDAVLAQHLAIVDVQVQPSAVGEGRRDPAAARVVIRRTQADPAQAAAAETGDRGFAVVITFEGFAADVEPALGVQRSFDVAVIAVAVIAVAVVITIVAIAVAPI